METPERKTEVTDRNLAEMSNRKIGRGHSARKRNHVELGPKKESNFCEL